MIFLFNCINYFVTIKRAVKIRCASSVLLSKELQGQITESIVV